MTNPLAAMKDGERVALSVEYDVANGIARRVIIFTDGSEEVDYFHLAPVPFTAAALPPASAGDPS